MKNFPSLVKEIDMQLQEAQESQTNWMHTGPLQDIIITMLKIKAKERIWKAAREKQLVTYRGIPIRLSADFSKETLQARRDWQGIFNVMKIRDLQSRLLYTCLLYTSDAADDRYKV